VRDFLFTTGFPRSGNTYLNYSFKSLYYPEENPRLNFHSVSSMEKYDHLFVPFRNPQDCISSWHNYPSNGQLEEDIKYYLRFYTAALENLNKLTLMDFNKFTNSLEYIKYKVKGSLSIDPIANPADSDIKAAMLDSGKTINLPVNNKAKLDVIKAQIVEIPSFQECLELYESLKSVTDIA
jgi:hypothetical protein